METQLYHCTHLREPDEVMEFRTTFGSGEDKGKNPRPVIEKVRMQRFGRYVRMSARVAKTVSGVFVISRIWTWRLSVHHPACLFSRAALDNPSRKGARTPFFPRMICS